MNVDEETKESECISETEDKSIENLSSEKCKTSTETTDSVSNEYEINEDCDINQLTTKLNDSFISNENEEEIFWQTEEWKHKKKHVFILSSAGKPIYSRYVIIMLTQYFIQCLGEEMKLININTYLSLFLINELCNYKMYV